VSGLGRLIAGLRFLDRLIAGAEIAIAVAATVGILAIVLTQVVLRALLDVWPHARELLIDWYWMGPVSRFLLLWATFAGASLAARARRHIAIDAVTKALPLRPRTAVNVLGSLVAAVISGLLARVALFVVERSWDDSTPLHGVDRGPVLLIIPIALAIMAFRFGIIVLEDARGAWTGDLAYLRAYEDPEAHTAAVEPAPGGRQGEARA
jgi:TRAP-type C4-dicarboxylate transport system permease small subunit